MKTLALAGAALLLAAPARGQTVSDGQLWTGVYLSAHATPGLLVSGEIVNRVVDDAGREGQIETRLQVGHALSKTVTVWAGWVHFTTYAASGRNGMENHAVEQLNWTPGKLGRVAVALRTRFEQRAVRGVGQTSWRVREQLRLVAPLMATRVSLVGWTEPFLAVNRTRAQPYLLERLRSFAGITVPLARKVDLEAGYLNEYLPRPAGKRDNHALLTSFNVRL